MSSGEGFSTAPPACTMPLRTPSTTGRRTSRCPSLGWTTRPEVTEVLHSLQLAASVDPRHGGPSNAAIQLARHITRHHVDPLVAAPIHNVAILEELSAAPYLALAPCSRPHIMENSWGMWRRTMVEARSR